MKDLLLIVAHLLTTLARLLGPGGAKAIVAQRIDGFIPRLFGQHLGAGRLMPFTKCPRAKLAIVNRSRQVPTQSEQIAYHTVNPKKTLRLPR